MNLTDTLGYWLPEVVAQLAYTSDVTVLQLLQHTSGIPNYLDTAMTASLCTDTAARTKQYTADDVVGLIRVHAPTPSLA